MGFWLPTVFALVVMDPAGEIRRRHAASAVPGRRGRASGSGAGRVGRDAGQHRAVRGHGGWDSARSRRRVRLSRKAAANPSLNLESVHPGYFIRLGVTIARGREFTDRDRAGATEVAVVSETWRRASGRDRTSIGRRLKFGNPTSDETWRTVVGVVSADALPRAGASTPDPVRAGEPVHRRRHDARAPHGGAGGAGRGEIARRSLHEVDPGVTVLRVPPFAEALDSAARAAPVCTLIGVFAATALLLATIGACAVIAGVRAPAIRGDRGPGGPGRDARGRPAARARRRQTGGAGGRVIAGAARSSPVACSETCCTKCSRTIRLRSPPPPSYFPVAVAALASYLPARRAVRLDVSGHAARGVMRRRPPTRLGASALDLTVAGPCRS